jgi:hypothetical protein
MPLFTIKKYLVESYMLHCCVQVNTFFLRSNAERFAEQMRFNGYTPIVKCVNSVSEGKK